MIPEPFVDTETDRTKSRWVAIAYRDFVRETGRQRTTLRGLFYYALKRKEHDYPICGKFVGEIRITRPYHESDGERLPKWISRARKLGVIPADAILDEVPGEQVFTPELEENKPHRVEVWLNKSALNPLLQPVCDKHGATLVSVDARPSKAAIDDLYRRSAGYAAIILCLSDLSASSLSFCRDLAAEIGKEKPTGEWDIRLKRIGLTPEQVLDLGIPQVTGARSGNVDEAYYRKYIEPYRLNPRKMSELDALEVHYPGGVAGFINDALSKIDGSDKEQLLLDLKGKQ
ncbi:MAG: hypothetical protein WB392_07980 [Methanotrichaceae archaeon]